MTMEHGVTLITTVTAGFGVALLLGIVAERMRMPALVGYLVPAFDAAGIADVHQRQAGVGSARQARATFDGALRRRREVSGDQQVFALGHGNLGAEGRAARLRSQASIAKADAAHIRRPLTRCA